MLNSKTYETTLALAAKLDEAGVVAAPSTNTVLSELVRLSVPPLEVAFDTSVPEGADAVMNHLMSQSLSVELFTTGTLDSPTQHSLEMDGYINDLSKLVTAHIAHAKNVVKPKVMDMANKLITYKETTANTEPSAKFNIVSLVTPNIFKDGLFLDSISGYRDTSIISPDLSFNLPNQSQEELVELISTGEKRTDDLILEWLGGLDADFLSTIWIAVFTKLPLDTGNKELASKLSYVKGNLGEVGSSNTFERADIMLAIFLFARKLMDHVVEGSEIPLQLYKRTAGQIKDFAGASLANCIKKIDLFISTKQLVLELDTARYTAKVNGELYKAWLAEGGCPEVILGLIVSGQMIYDQSMIDSKRDAFKAQWESYYTFAKTGDINKSFYNFKNYVKDLAGEILENLEDDAKEYIHGNSSRKETIIKLIEDEIERFKHQDMDDIQEVALTIVAKCIYCYTSAYNILHDMKEAAEVNADIDVREAALLAAVNYIADYLAAQITLNK